MTRLTNDPARRRPQPPLRWFHLRERAISMRMGLSCVGFLAAALLGSEATGAIVPRDLLIYYSWPSLINGASGNIELAATEFARYDDIVLGDLLEKTSHPDHANTVAILAHPSLASVRSFGYIDLGVAPGQNLSLAEIRTRVDEWQATGADGILFDEFGYDYGVSRERQNAAVSYAQTRGMLVIANAWVPGDALGSEVHATLNPTGLPPVLGPSDFYLFESFQIQEGVYVPESFWQQKAAALETYRESIGVLAVTTELPEDVYDEAKFHYAWFSGLLYGYDGIGWGEYLFAALDAEAPFRARPTVAPGEMFISDIVHQNPEHWRFSNTGRIRVNASAHSYGYLPGITDAEGDVSMPARMSVWPNPSSGVVSIALGSYIGSSVDKMIVVLDAEGRRVGSVPVPSGVEVVIWAPPGYLASGWYFFDLQALGASLATARALHVR